MSDNHIVLVGGGGHCTSVIDVIELEGRFRIAGIVDRQNIGKKVLGYPIIASDNELSNIAKEYNNFLITVGHIESNAARIRLFEQLKQIGANFPIIISPRAYVSTHSKIEEGTIVMHGAFVNAATKVGKNNIINTSAIIEHDSTIGDHCHISTAAVVNGGCTIGSHTFIGSDAVLRQSITITDHVVIGAGSVVLSNIEKSGVYAGNPSTWKRQLNG